MLINQNTCIENCDSCHWNGSLGNCCSGNCNHLNGQDLGHCRQEGDSCDDPTSSTRPRCIPDCDSCHRSGSLGFCCSGMCIQMQGDDFGYCQAHYGSCNVTTPHPTCIPDCDDCDWTGSIGFCCSGLCIQLPNKETGYCNRSRGSTEGNCVGHEFDEGTGQLFLQILPYLLSGLVVLILAGISVWLWYYWKNRNRSVLDKTEVRRFFKGSECTDISFLDKEVNLEDCANIHGADYSVTYKDIHNVPYDTKFEVSSSAFQIDFDHILGSGQFGLVLRGCLNGKPVAVKTLNENVESMYLKALLTELKVLIYLGNHNNIVSLVGAHTAKLSQGKVYLFLEYCPLGSLYNFLQNKRHEQPLTQPDLAVSLGINGYAHFSSMDSTSSSVSSTNTIYCVPNMINWSIQIANALDFLSRKNVIHGDVASRNVLLFSESHLKLTDFGLSRRLYEYNIYLKKHGEPLPFRWLSVESLQHLTFSKHSDIWSFGITMWEIFMLGELPFPHQSWTEEFVSELKAGMRLRKPDIISDEIYDIMKSCWRLDPKSRPSAREVAQLLERFTSSS